MSQLRKRSQDARISRAIDDAETATPNSTSGHTKTLGTSRVVAASLFLALTLIGILFWRLQWNSAASPATLFDNAQVKSANQDFTHRLSPEIYINRKPGIVNQKWRITSGSRRPDGVLKRVYLINDAFPGPTVECRSGDRLVIEVENALDDEGVSVHWHGLSMRGANEMDGAIGITNNAIYPGESFTYDFTVDESQSGTFWYHSHYQNQRADGLYGALIVHKPKAVGNEPVDVEHVLAVGDWYHRSAEEALHFYSHPGGFGNEPVPDSILLNGNGAFNCSDAVPARPLDCTQRSSNDLPTLKLDWSKRNLLRIINVGSYAGIGVSSPGHHFVPDAVDGGNRVAGTYSKAMQYLHPGERVDVVIEPAANHVPEHSWLEVYLETKPFKYPNSALTPMHVFPISWTDKEDQSRETSTDQDVVDLQALEAAEPRGQQLFPPLADQLIILYAITQRLAHLENEPRGFINNTSWKPQTSPRIPLTSLSRDEWDDNQFVPRINFQPQKPLWVDIVLNNLDEEGHPFHLHGYDFWVLSTYSSTYNWGSYNPLEDEEAPGGDYNLVNPVKKDTVYVPRRGYAVLRLRADNPGFWMFHCHVLWHQASGMAMAFEVGS